MRLSDRVAIVTGAAQGIGAAISDEFLKEGAIVYGLDRSEQPERDGKFHAIRADLTNHDLLRAVVQDIVGETSRLDILVNNAAISYYEDLLSSSLEHWRHTQSVNVESHYVLSQLVAPHMARGAGDGS